MIQEQVFEASIIYVVGPEHKQWLDEILESKKIVMDIRYIGYVEPARAAVTVCANHNVLSKVVCALHHAKLLRTMLFIMLKLWNRKMLVNGYYVFDMKKKL